MRTIKGKARDRYVNAYAMSCIDSLYACYSKPSKAKIAAHGEYWEKMHQEHGYDFRIISHNTYAYTCGWLMEDPETGVIMLRVETPENSYIMEY